MKSQQGNSIAEMVIVAIIVGVLVTAVFQGAQIVENSHANKTADAFIATAAAVQSYQSLYGYLPGDDGPAATLRLRGDQWQWVKSGDADGNLEVATNQTFSGAGESGAFWQHLKAAGLLGGDPVSAGAAALPDNAWGGVYGVLATVMGGNLAGVKICASDVPGAAAETVEAALDDSTAATGRLRATPGTRGANTSPANTIMHGPYLKNEVYTLCYAIQDR